MRIEELEFTVFDTETTGLSPDTGDRIIEIAGIRFKGSKKLSTFSSLINPKIPIPTHVQEIHGITDEMVMSAPTISEVLPKFLEFIEGSYLCAYNAGFDLAFLEKEMGNLGLVYPQELVLIDLFKMARRLLPGLEKYSLEFVGKSLRIDFGELHRALADTELEYEIFIRLKEKLYEKNIFEIKDLISLFAINGKSLENINEQKLIQIQEAIDKNLKLRIKYLSAKDSTVTERDILPKEIKSEKKNIYLIGFCFLRNEERSFRLDGILDLRVL